MSTKENIQPHQQVNFDRFYFELVEQYEYLFKNDPEYSYSASKISSQDLARKMVIGLDSGTANKEGKAVKNVCKILGIPNTYKAIREFIGHK